jgi:hypothetical protein
MVIPEEVKQVFAASTSLGLVTMCPNGEPHPIIAGSGKVQGDTVVFGIYKMEQTQKNLAACNKAWVLGCATIDGKPKGYRLAGTACAKDKQLIFVPEKCEVLL